MANNALADIELADESDAWRTVEDHSYDERRLWMAVIDRAVRDARGDIESFQRHRHARIRWAAIAWLRDKSIEVGSLRWIIQSTGLPTTAEAIYAAAIQDSLP